MRGIVDCEYQDGEIAGLLFLCGMRGMGKTTEMDRLLSLCTGGVLFFDTLSKHAEILKGYTIFSEARPLIAYLRVNHGRRFRVLYQPRSGDLDKHFAAVCSVVRAFGWMIFGIDELDKLCGAEWGAKRMPPELYHLVNYGRHERVSMIATARNPKAVARGYTAESEMRIFRTEEQSYRDYFADRLGDAAAERLASLPRFCYLRKVGDSPIELCGGQRPL
jgi:hypothetical protein